MPRHEGRPERDRSGDESVSTTVPRAVNPASNPLAASVRDRHLDIRARGLALRRSLVDAVWICVGISAVAAWVALVYAVGA